ncbi:hypothetical protein KBX37_16345 [Micromonospora sp. U56]|uniref:hypothetical protein n=1 Tax=Micromonospora sp. U56 TaxID=2824900 RepID=UPI001B389A64|nr:hypothetical protein [Micromonospora sp. U56]MBQ0894649.1 hypothetical protein [Micromonospora sp. U56]
MTAEDAERRLFGEMFRHLDRIEPWLQRMDPDGPYERPQERSALSRDDKETHPHRMSHAAWHSLSHAVDHLNCLRTLLKDAQMMHMYAPYSIARAALENACAAVWLLAPDDRAERILRRLRLAALDIRGGEAARRLLTDEPGRRTEEERVEELREIARRRGIDAKAAVQRLGYAEIVQVAGDTSLAGSVPFQFTWRMCSAIAHGDLWATLNVVSREEIPGAPPGLVGMRITANVETLSFAVRLAVEMTDAGWRLYDERSRRGPT